MENQIEIFKTKDNQTEVQVLFDKDTLWLNQKQISEVFGTAVPAINKHIKNILKESELQLAGTVSKMEIVQIEGKRKVSRKLEFYNLDMIISVGYRVNSAKATQFRIWATQRLKDYLLKGYAINEKRLKETQNKFQELKQAVSLLDTIIKKKPITGDEAQGLLKVLHDYAFALDILDQYDHQTLQISETKSKELFKIS